MNDLYVDVTLASWVKPMLRELGMLYRVGHISKDALNEVVRILVTEGLEIGPICKE